jgi:ADP-ribose pyrophosphatase YjhB (NUDIX family)
MEFSGSMPFPKLDISTTNKPMHFSVGAIIKRDAKYLLIDRAVIPLGFAGPAGHVDEDETPEEAVRHEVKEECGLTVTECKQIHKEEVLENECSQHLRVHYWYLFECQVEGELKQNERETKSIGWYSKEEIQELELEEIWKYWFSRVVFK